MSRQCSWGCDLAAGVRNPSCTVHGADTLTSNLESLSQQVRQKAQGTMDCQFWMVVADEIERLTKDRDLWKERHDRERAAHAKNLTEQQKCEAERDRLTRELVRWRTEALAWRNGCTGKHGSQAACVDAQKFGEPSPDETPGRQCQHDLLKPDTTVVVQGPYDASCPVCKGEWHIPHASPLKAPETGAFPLEVPADHRPGTEPLSRVIADLEMAISPDLSRSVADRFELVEKVLRQLKSAVNGNGE